MGGRTTYVQPEKPRTDTTYAYLDKIPVDPIDRVKNDKAASKSAPKTKPKNSDPVKTETSLNIA
tara:strand:+ start:808 stop:999 length:192 start_codon:yes stop_codon:yes gene_type:complete